MSESVMQEEPCSEEAESEKHSSLYLFPSTVSPTMSSAEPLGASQNISEEDNEMHKDDTSQGILVIFLITSSNLTIYFILIIIIIIIV